MPERHAGENRHPSSFNSLASLDTGFRRYDTWSASFASLTDRRVVFAVDHRSGKDKFLDAGVFQSVTDQFV
jgi:hypothetical protein